MPESIADLLFKGSQITGEIGIEIEMEGDVSIQEDVEGWFAEHDGSLRGDSREYVLSEPIKREDTWPLLQRLDEALRKESAIINPSIRTGVHIHTNVRNFTYNQLFTYLFTYYMFEDIMMDWAGKERVGNLFCLRARDAEGLLPYIDKVLTSRDLKLFNTDDIRYSALNLRAINAYGSVEFRGLPFKGDFHNIQTWIELILCIKDFSLTVKDPIELVSLLSKEGGEKLAKRVFGNLYPALPNVDWNHKMLNGIRLVQQLVFKHDWEEVEVSYYTIKTNIKQQEEVRYVDIEV